MYKALLQLAVLLVVVPSLQAQVGTSKPPGHPADSKVIAESTETNPEAKSLYEDGMARLEMGQVSEAVERFQRAIKIDPEYGEAYAGLGRAYFKLRQWDNAVAPLRRAIALKAKAKERHDSLQQNPVRSVEPRVTPPSPVNSPVSKPPASNSNKPYATPDTKAPGLVALNVQPQRIPSLSSVSTHQSNLNKSLPTLRINNQAAIATSDSTPKRLQLPHVEPRASIMSDDLQSPPPEIVAKAAAVDQPVQPASAMNVKPLTAVEVESVSAPIAPTDEIALTSIYRVGSKDVLDIRLNNSQPQQQTAFTVNASGSIEHPQLSAPLAVTGLTVDEIRARIEEDLKKQASTETKVFVGVLEHASHSIVVDGLVKTPGAKVLKSEAIPLAVVLAEAQPLPEAAKVTVVRGGSNQILQTDLSHIPDLSFLVHPGDVITLHPHVNEFFYIEGKVRSAGEQRYRVGLTLTQAIIAAGGATSSNTAEIARDEAGELVRTRFDLKAIESGKAADPPIKPGDRITLH